MKNSWLLRISLLAVLLAAVAGLPAMAQELGANHVNVKLANVAGYSTDDDVIANVPLEFDNHLFVDIINEPDGGSPVLNPKIELQTVWNLSSFWPNDPLIFTPQPELGLYTWDFQSYEIPEPSALFVNAWTAEKLTRTPGLYASRSVEPEILAGDITTQTITLTLRLEEPLPTDVNFIRLAVGSRAEVYAQNNLVQSRFVYQNEVTGWAGHSSETDAAWTANPADLELGKTYVFEAQLASEKSSELAGSPIFKPFTTILYNRYSSQPATTANSITLAFPDNSVSAKITADNVVDWVPSVEEFRFGANFNPVTSRITPAPFQVIVDADLAIEPRTLNPDASGIFTAFIKLPERYKATDVGLSTVKAQDVPALSAHISGDTLIAKFGREGLRGIEAGEEVVITVTGRLSDGSLFEGTDTVRVMEP